MGKIVSCLQFITQGQNREQIIAEVGEFLEAGGDWVQLRMKDSSEDEFLECAKVLRKMCGSAVLIINDNVQIAKLSGADGVHLGKSDMATDAVRAILGRDVFVGRTASSIEDIIAMSHDKIDYIGLGPYKWTTTKKNISTPLGLEGYRVISDGLKGLDVVPIVAIGSVTIEDIDPLSQIDSLCGVAVSGAISKSDDRVEMTRRFMKEIKLKFKKNMDQLIIADKVFNSRLFTGTGKFSSSGNMYDAIVASGSELVTVALKRVDINRKDDDILFHLRNNPRINLLPNTSGVRCAEEAIFAAELSREALGTNWLKLEIHPDPRYLFPDPIETLKATEELVKRGFVVMPYINADPVLCKRLEDVGAAVVMPLAAPIGSNKGLATREILRIIIEQSRVPVIIDAGIGAPSHAAEAMEMGASAVLVNTAIAASPDAVAMGRAFRLAVEAGRIAHLAKLATVVDCASATSPLTSFLDI